MSRQNTQECCPFSIKFSRPSGDSGYSARPAREAEWDRGPADGDVSAETSDEGTSREDDDGPTQAVIPTTDGPALVDLMRMTREEWDVWTRGSAIRRAGYSGLRRNVAVAMGNWLAKVEEAPREAVAVLRDALEGESALVPEHAEWALQQVDLGSVNEGPWTEAE